MMPFKLSIVETLIKNKDRILDAGKYDESKLNELIKYLGEAEELRSSVLSEIQKTNSIDVNFLKEKLNISSEVLELNLEYLKELGFLDFINQNSVFFNEIIEKSKREGKYPNIAPIRDKLLCCGCGLCVSICPVSAISYETHLELDEDKCIHCGLCYIICPRTFYPSALNPPKSISNTIDFVQIFTAKTTDEKILNKASNGGIVSSLLMAAFRANLIDGALVVSESCHSHKPVNVLINNEEDIFNTAGTFYSIAHTLKILHESRNLNKLAIVGTSCIMEALKKISVYPLNKPFYSHVKYKIGLFCMESFDYDKIVEITKKEFQKNPDQIKKMSISKGRFYVFDKSGEIYNVPIKRIKKYGRFGCFFCDDLTAIQADISIGSIGSEHEWSTVIVRTQKGAELFENAVNLKIINFKPIEKDSSNFKSLFDAIKSKKKQYRQIFRQKMIEQVPKLRVINFKEVANGLNLERVKLETQRCLQCGNPLCITGCPVNIDIPGFIKLLKEEKYLDAIRKVKDYNLLPAVCGRVCPQEVQCESKCLLNAIHQPIAIGYLERFIADWERSNQLKECPDCEAPNNIKVAVIGSGPAGLTCAADLARKGYDVTIFEAFHKGGGVLIYGIPEFRLPKEIVEYELEILKMLGVQIKYNVVIGKTLTIDDLKKKGFKAIFIGIGAGTPIFLGIPGENLKGIISANEFLTRINLMKAYEFPNYKTPIINGKNVIVIGGGNVAMDSARSAIRLGAKTVYIVYRRAMEQLPARREEVHHAIEEGIIFKLLTNPIKFIGDQEGNVQEIEVIKMELGPPDSSGRASPIPIKNSEFRIKTDLVILAIGNNANPLLPATYPVLKLNKWGYIETDDNYKTNVEGVYAGGDIVTGSATVISAMGAGREAAKNIDSYLKNVYKHLF